ncbi:hypothetical protein [Ktedonobacter robiniae]|uniref:Uncharacterized protein n=1 Tax=Ktedonobacter robiniae TaxID=2778365 RepID=A0ABQ3UQF2_9CHLR|nr:hypothetical protein [Ktedonobacter robiniae]GHO55011.1 hypothetical protein KSB_34860 [Ktedonobacter robiniae]
MNAVDVGTLASCFALPENMAITSVHPNLTERWQQGERAPFGSCKRRDTKVVEDQSMKRSNDVNFV